MVDSQFLKLVADVVFCPERCDGVVNDRENGIIPRALILRSLSGKRVEPPAKVGIIGINPGRHLTFENVYYKEALDHVKDRRGLAKKLHNVWSAELFSEKSKPWLPYFANTVKFLRGVGDVIGIGEENPILWGEVVYCELADGYYTPPKSTVEKCTSRYMKRFLDLVAGELIICLGSKAYTAVRELAEGRMAEAFEGMKILGVYHPSGRKDFYEYFEDYESDEIKQSVIDRLTEFTSECRIAFLKFREGKATLSL